MRTPYAEPGKEYVYTVEHEVNVVNLSQSGCGVNKTEERKTAREWDPRTHESLVMTDSGASVNVCPKWFGMGTPDWTSLMVQPVSEEQTENRSRNTERDRSG